MHPTHVNLAQIFFCRGEGLSLSYWRHSPLLLNPEVSYQVFKTPSQIAISSQMNLSSILAK
jgi:hypothetical protein